VSKSKWVHPHPSEIGELLSKLPKVLRPDDQMTVVNTFVDAYRKIDKGISIAPPGWGKTLVFLETIRRIASQEPKFVAAIFEPRITLCCQTIEAAVQYLIAQLGEHWAAVMVSSGSPYARTRRKINKLFAKYAHNNPIMSTTTAAELVSQVDRLHADGFKVLVVSTYHSNACARRSGINFHVKVNDECHNLVTTSDLSGFRGTHDVPANLTISTTASPQYSDGKGDDAVGMQNAAIWGEELSNISACEAMNNKVILPQRLDYVDMALDEGRLNDPIDEDFAKIVEYQFSALDQNEIMLNNFAKANADLISPKVLFGLPGQFWLRAKMINPRLKELMRERGDVNLVGMSSGLGVWVWPAGKAEPDHYNFTADGKDELFSFVDDLLSTDKLMFEHVRTVGEGTDLPGLTGFAPMCDLSKTRVIQDCNRPCRIGSHDRYHQMVRGSIPDDEWVKKFGIVHLPYCIDGGSDVVASYENILRSMRSMPDFDPSSTIRESKKAPLPPGEEPIRDTGRNPRGNPYDQTAEFWHSCEQEDADDERWRARRELRNAIHEGNDDYLEALLEEMNDEG